MRSSRQIVETDHVDFTHPGDHIEPEENNYDLLAAALRSILVWVSEARTTRGGKARLMLLNEALSIGPRRTMAEIARVSGVSKSTISDNATELRERLGLPILGRRNN